MATFTPSPSKEVTEKFAIYDVKVHPYCKISQFNQQGTILTIKY